VPPLKSSVKTVKTINDCDFSGKDTIIFSWQRGVARGKGRKSGKMSFS
jgi:hypothetical protein